MNTNDSELYANLYKQAIGAYREQHDETFEATFEINMQNHQQTVNKLFPRLSGIA